VEDEMAISGSRRTPHSFLSISVERLADGDGWPGKRGDLWPLWVSIAVDAVFDSAAAPVDIGARAGHVLCRFCGSTPF
jgi:hypothetical protein